MTTAAPSTALATIQPAVTGPGRLALAGYLAGYRGLTRDACPLGLRQVTTWCRARSVPWSAVRRAGIESSARDLQARGRARSAVTRRLCTIAGSREIRRRGRTPRTFPGRTRPPAPGSAASGMPSPRTAASPARCWPPPASGLRPSMR